MTQPVTGALYIKQQVGQENGEMSVRIWIHRSHGYQTADPYPGFEGAKCVGSDFSRVTPLPNEPRPGLAYAPLLRRREIVENLMPGFRIPVTHPGPMRDDARTIEGYLG